MITSARSDQLAWQHLEGHVLQDRYRLVKLLDASPSDAVWYANDLNLERAVAVRVSTHQHCNAEKLLAAARTQAKVSHPNILPIYDAGSEGDLVYVVSKLIVLELGNETVPSTLETWSQQRRPPPPRKMVCRVLLDVVEALHAIHRVTRVHSNVTLANILVDESALVGRPIGLLIDGACLSGSGSPPPIRAPEVWTSSGEIEAASDIYALGIVLCQALSGQHPLGEQTSDEAWQQAHQQGESDVRLPAISDKGDSTEVSELIRQMMLRNPAARPSLQEVVKVLRAVVGEFDRSRDNERRLDLQPVYIINAVTSILTKNASRLSELVLKVAQNVFTDCDTLRDEIEAIYFGAMGHFPTEDMDLAVGQIPFMLRERLPLPRLHGTGYHPYSSTSDSGAMALQRAFQDIQIGKHKTVLVVAGETMYPTTMRDKDKVREAHQKWISTVFDPADLARVNGLTMNDFGELLQNHMIWRSGLDRALWARILKVTTLAKLRFGHAYEPCIRANRARNQGGGHPYGSAEYQDPSRNRSLCDSMLRVLDVAESANGATAIILSANEDVLRHSPPIKGDVWPAGRFPIGTPRHRIRLVGMGEGHARISLSERHESCIRSSAIRRGIRDLCESTGVSPEGLTRKHTIRGILHDAFPSIELAFLVELAHTRSPAGGWSWVLGQYLETWGNPLGGLVAAGHALGNSGLFQIAKAFHILTQSRPVDRASLDPDARAQLDAPYYLTSSVGGPLTNVVMSLISDEACIGGSDLLSSDKFSRRELARGDNAFTWDNVDQAIQELAKNEGAVMGRARLYRNRSGTVLLVACPGPHGPRMQLAVPEGVVTIGDVVEVISWGRDTASVAKARLTNRRLRRPQLGIEEQHAILATLTRVEQALRDGVYDGIDSRRAVDRETRLLEPLGYLLDGRNFDDDAKRALRSVSAQAPMAVTYMDLNGVKDFNKLGHHVGTEAISLYLERVSRIKGPNIDAYRLSGGADEVIILWYRTSLDEAVEYTRDLLQALQQITVANRPLTAAAGIVVAADRKETVELVRNRADTEQYRAKAQVHATGGGQSFLAWPGCPDPLMPVS